MSYWIWRLCLSNINVTSCHFEDGIRQLDAKRCHTATPGAIVPQRLRSAPVLPEIATTIAVSGYLRTGCGERAHSFPYRAITLAFVFVGILAVIASPTTKVSDRVIVVACPMSPEQSALQQGLVDRYEGLLLKKIEPRIDNALNITTDGRKLAIHARMRNANASDFPKSKINRLVENVAAISERTKNKRDTRIISADIGIHPTRGDIRPTMTSSGSS